MGTSEHHGQTNHSWRVGANSFRRRPRPRGITAHNLKGDSKSWVCLHEAGGGTRERSKPQRSSLRWCPEDTASWPETSAARADQQRSQQSRISCEQGGPRGHGSVSLHLILSYHLIPFQIQQTSFSDKGQTSPCV